MAGTLKEGTLIGPYEITGAIGAGGMGEVYRAKDSRLGREVAIKVLPAEFSADPDRLRRFEQEARSAGMLNHSNLLTVYDIGVHEGSPYVVSELLTGETLRERIGGTAIGYRKALEYALQIAYGMAAAHEKGIVHRDLKPENIFITRDGRVKILDFGLAKLLAPSTPSGGKSNLATMDIGTQPGVVLGTVGYMSPEQVRGREVDHRSDLFSFGAVLYEMLTGKRAFQRDSTADTMSAILKEDPPDPSSINRNIPAALERIIRHSLEKNPEERFQSARDLAFDLEMVSGISGIATEITSPASRPISTRWKAAFVLLGLLLLAGIATAVFFKSYSRPTVAASFQRLTFRRGYVSGARFAPDNQTILYSAAWTGSLAEVFSTRPQSPVSKSLNMPADLLSVSSSGEMAILLRSRFTVGFQRTGTLARVPIDGGAPREVLEEVQDAEWTPDGKELAVVRNTPRKRRVEFPIGKIVFETEGWVSHLRFSPDGKRLAAFHHPITGDDRGTVIVFDLNGQHQELTDEWSSASGLAWSPDGDEIWFTASSLGSNQQPLRAVTLARHQRVLFTGPTNVIIHDVSRTGAVLLAQDNRRREMIGWTQSDAKEQDLSWFDWSFPRDLSKDGKVVLFEEQGAGGGHLYSVYLRGLDGSPAVRLGDGFAASLSSDGRWALTYLPDVNNKISILPTGPGQAKQIAFPRFTRISGGTFFPDDERLLIMGFEKGHAARLWVYDIESTELNAVTPEGIFASFFVISRDAKYVLARCVQGGFCLYPVGGGDPQVVKVLEEREVPFAWTTDNDTVYTVNQDAFPVRIHTLNLKTGERKFWKEIEPPDLAGAQLPIQIQITADGSAYVYTYRRLLSDLYLVQDLK